MYIIRITGPGMDSSLAISGEQDLDIAIAHVEKIRRWLKSRELRPAGRYGIDQGQFLAECGGGNAAFGERNSGGTPE